METNIRLVLKNLQRNLEGMNADVSELQRLSRDWPNGSQARVAIDVMQREVAFFQMYLATLRREAGVDDTASDSNWQVRQGPGGPRFDLGEEYRPGDSQRIVDPAMMETRIDARPAADERQSSVDWKMFNRALETPARGEELVAPESNRVMRDDDDVEGMFADMPTRQETFPADAEDTRSK
ncbi:hypothetical protein KQI84_05055 [bacterium]|nr:hypothetical protein [bacterium]